MATNSPSDHGLEADATAVKDCSALLGRVLNHPRSFEAVVRASGASLDKVSEIMLTKISEGHASRLSDIADKLGVELSSVSRKVHKLEKDGLVERHPDPNDARASRLSLTARGEAELEKMHHVRLALVREILSSWDADDRHHFATLYQRFYNDIVTRLETPQ